MIVKQDMIAYDSSYDSITTVKMPCSKDHFQAPGRNEAVGTQF